MVLMVNHGLKTAQSVFQEIDREKEEGSVADNGGSQGPQSRKEVEVYERDVRADPVKSAIVLATRDVDVPLCRLEGPRRDGNCSTSSLPFWKLFKKCVDD
jgi:hypothetical protein